MFIIFPSQWPESLVTFLEHAPKEMTRIYFLERLPGPEEAQYETTAALVTELGIQVSTIQCHTHLATPTLLFKKKK